MKNKIKRKTIIVLCLIMAIALPVVPCSAAAKDNVQTATTGNAAAKKDKIVLKKKKGKYYCYKNGKLVKKKWMTIAEKTYYFTKSGAAATGSTKIGKSYYIFNTKGVLQQSKSTKIVTIGKKKYQVTASGKAKKGWSANKKYYFYKTGEAVTGIEVIGGKFYAFSSSGKYNAEKTSKLRKASKYGKNITSLKKLIGKPQKSKYYSDSCYGDGKDGVLKYKKFKVYTFKYRKSGKEIFLGAE